MEKTTIHERRRAGKRPRRIRYSGSGALAMCGPGPHPGGALFRNLCALADRFRAAPDDPAAVKIGSVLSLLAFHASRPSDRDFRYALGSFLMDLAIMEEEEALARAAALPRLGKLPGASEPRRALVPYDRVHPVL
jgi:hypothetical protein